MNISYFTAAFIISKCVRNIFVESTTGMIPGHNMDHEPAMSADTTSSHPAQASFKRSLSAGARSSSNLLIVMGFSGLSPFSLLP